MHNTYRIRRARAARSEHFDNISLYGAQEKVEDRPLKASVFISVYPSFKPSPTLIPRTTGTPVRRVESIQPLEP